MKISTFLSMVISCIYMTAPSQAQHIVVQRTTSIGPMGFHFTVSDTDWNTIANSDYKWTFSNGDTAIGYQAVHTYFDDGSWVALQTTKADNSITTDTMYLSVTPEDMGFDASGNVCISSTGNFEGAPTGATLITATNLEAVTFFPNARFMFRKDDTFNISTSKTMPSLTRYSSFGSGDNPPLIIVSGDATTTTFWMADDVSVSDIDFIGAEWVTSEAWGGSIYGEGRLFAPENYATFYNLNVKNMTSFAIMDDGIGAKKNLIIEKVNAENLGSYFVYAGVSPSIEYSGVKDCKVNNVISNHGIRLNGGQYFVANNIHIDSVDRSHITFRGLRHGVISDSKFTGKGLYKNSIRNIYDDASTADSVMYIIYERNQYESRQNEYGIDLNIGNDIIVRNNLFLNSGFNVGINASGVIPQNVHILQNTFYQNNFDWVTMVILRSGGSGIFKGNLAYADDCVSTDCIASNPFAEHSISSSPNWDIDYNAYYVSGDPSGTQFKSGMSWTAWKGLGNDEHSNYGIMTFNNKTASISTADFKPMTGAMINTSPFMTHRDLNKNKRRFGTTNEAGAINTDAPSSVLPIEIVNQNGYCYPNPSSDFVIFMATDFDQYSPIRVSIIDNLGKTVMQKDNFTITDKLIIEHLPIGNYWIQLQSKDFRKSTYKLSKR